MTPPHDLPDNIARIQWNNRLKSGALCFCFALGMAVFAVTLFLMIAVPASLIPDSGLSITRMFADPKMQLKILRFFLKIFFLRLCRHAVFHLSGHKRHRPAFRRGAFQAAQPRQFLPRA